MTVALVKRPRPPAEEPEFDRDLILERLFALPVPPMSRGGRDGKTYPIHTPLGRILRLKGWQKRQLSSASPDVPNDRVLTEILAGRQEIGHHRAALARALEIDPRIL